MVVIDATHLLLLLRPDTPVPAGPDGRPIEKPKERIEYLIQQLSNAQTKVVIPTPALSEALVRAGAAASQQMVEYLQRYSVFRIEPFDTRAAIELAAMTRDELNGRKKKGPPVATHAKLKFDRQIVAIAKVVGASTIYSDDKGLATFAKASNIEVVGLADLPLPPQDAQLKIDFTSAGDEVAEDLEPTNPSA